MHLLLSIPSEKSTSFKMCVYLKNHLFTKVFVLLLFSRQKNTDAAFQPPHPCSTSTGSLALRNQPPAVLIGKYLFTRKVRLEDGKGNEKQGSSAVDISIPMMAAFFRHCTTAAAVSHTTQAQHVTGLFLGCRAVI